MAEKTLYDILEVSPNASDEAIHRAYTFLSAKHDPTSESNRAKPEARIQYDAVKYAFATLSNPERRARYDKTLAARSAPALEAKRAQPFWSLLKVTAVLVAIVLVVVYYYQHKREVARLETEKAIAAAKARADEETAKAQTERTRLALQRERELRIAEEQERREREMALSRYSAERQHQ